MNIHELADRVAHPERHPEGPRSGLGGALAANFAQTRQRNQDLVGGLVEGYRREHPELDPEHPTREQVEELAAAALGRLLQDKLTESLAAGFGELYDNQREETPP